MEKYDDIHSTNTVLLKHLFLIVEVLLTFTFFLSQIALQKKLCMLRSTDQGTLLNSYSWEGEWLSLEVKFFQTFLQNKINTSYT